MSQSYPWAHIPYDPNTVSTGVYTHSYPEQSLRQRRFLNIGAGSFQHQFWTNLDYHSDWYAGQQAGTEFINHDLESLKPIQLEDGFAEEIYTSHTIEHLSDEAVRVMFKEARRLLKPGGRFRITTPDTDLFYLAWKNNDVGFYYWRDFYSHPDICTHLNTEPLNKFGLGQIFLFNIATHISAITKTNQLKKISDSELEDLFNRLPYEEALNYLCSLCPVEEQRKNPGFHRNWHNENKIRRMLLEAGFKLIYKSGYGQSRAPAMRDVTLFDLQDPKVSIYMEAVAT